MKRIPHHQQRGAALLLAMIIVTLVATLAVSMVWQQWRAVQVETAERARSQSAWILAGALDWAGLILKEDARPSAGAVDHLGEPWAVPLAEARLSTFLAADKDNTDDGPEAFLSGSISDAQARFNVRNLLDEKLQISPSDVEVLYRLCDNVSVPRSVADSLASGLKTAYSKPSGPDAVADPPLRPTRMSQLSWLGIDAQALQRLEPYVVLLQDAPDLMVNVNTASREVIAAVLDINVGDAERLIQHRQRTPFRNTQEVATQLGPSVKNINKVAVASNYFEVRGRLRLNDRVLEQRSMVHKTRALITVLSSERVNSTDRER